ncbi:MAG: PIN domain-containing protein [Thermodesulfobacteriota bacterium]
MKRIFLDANVIFTAAHNPAGKSALLFELARKGYWELLTSQLAYEEARRNIDIKFSGCLPEIDKLIKEIKIIPHTVQSSCPLELPNKDKPIFLAALQGGATHLLTGDLTHFGPFMNKAADTKGILIQTVSEFLLSLIE